MISIKSSTGSTALPLPFFGPDVDRVRVRAGTGGGGMSLLSSSLSLTSLVSDELA